jgi:hypothetical protein
MYKKENLRRRESFSKKMAAVKNSAAKETKLYRIYVQLFSITDLI